MVEADGARPRPLPRERREDGPTPPTLPAPSAASDEDEPMAAVALPPERVRLRPSGVEL
jgi:hypothetical protein